MTIERHNRDAWKIILSFLSAQDFRSLSLTGKTFLLKVRENQDIIAKHFHAKISLNQDLFLSDIYQHPEYIMFILKNAHSSLNGQSSDTIKSYEMAKYSFRNFLSGIFGQEKSLRVVKTINDALVAPRLPPPKLRRENFDCETFSMYQIHLTDVHNGYDEETTVNRSKMIDESQIFELDAIMKEQWASVNENHKMCLLSARWYSTECLDYSQTIEFGDSEEEEKSARIDESRNLNLLTKKISKFAINKPQSLSLKLNKKKAFHQKLATHNYMSQKPNSKVEQENSPILVEIYKNLNAIFTNYCKVVFNGLENISNPFLFMAEYSTKWKNYVVSMQSLGGYLREYTQIMNQVYEKLFQGYANYPEFRIWRMMVRIWHEEVFYKLEKRISTDFKEVLNSYLNHFSSGIRKNQHQIASEDLRSAESIPSIFLESEFDVSNVIGEFYHSIIDVALNERTIFTLIGQDLLNFGPSSGFCSQIHALIKERCSGLIQESNLSVANKSEVLINTAELIESFLPQQVFPQIFELIIGSLQSLLVECSSWSNQIEGNKAFNLPLNDGLNCEISESMSISYPSFTQHAQYCKKKLQQIQTVLSEREKKIADSALKGFSLTVCDLEKTFMNFDRRVDLKVLEECRSLLAN